MKRIFKRLLYIIKMILLKIYYSESIIIKGKYSKISIKSINALDIKKGTIFLGNSITIEEYSKIGVRDNGIINIGNNFFANHNLMCVCHKKIDIGNNVSIGPNVCIYDHDHDFNQNGKINDKYKTGKIIIGNNVWIGAGCIILRDTIIGDNCVIGAGTIVKGNIPNNSLVTSNRNMKITKLEKRKSKK